MGVLFANVFVSRSPVLRLLLLSKQSRRSQLDIYRVNSPITRTVGFLAQFLLVEDGHLSKQDVILIHVGNVYMIPLN